MRSALMFGTFGVALGAGAVPAIAQTHTNNTKHVQEHVARTLARLGKPAAAALIQGKLPITKAIRSGDLGESTRRNGSIPIAAAIALRSAYAIGRIRGHS